MKSVYKVLLAAVVVAALLSPFASSSPDGLMRVATDLGFINKQEGSAVIAPPVGDYLFPGIKNEAAAKAVAGVAGTALTFLAMYGLARIVKNKDKPSDL